MTGLSTHDNLAAHYLAVRRRLYAPKPLALPASVRVEDRVVRIGPFNFYATPGFPSLLRFASLKTGVSEERIMSRTRTDAVVHARGMLMSLMRRHKEVSLPMISRRWGMDHTSALNSIKQYESGATQARFDRAKAKEAKRARTVARRRENPLFKWTDERLERANEMHEDGTYLADIAAWFGVSRSALQAALMRYRKRQHKMVKRVLTSHAENAAA